MNFHRRNLSDRSLFFRRQILPGQPYNQWLSMRGAFHYRLILLYRESGLKLDFSALYTS
jgi:hypothetical protein